VAQVVDAGAETEDAADWRDAGFNRCHVDDLAVFFEVPRNGEPLLCPAELRDRPGDSISEATCVIHRIASGARAARWPSPA
jgi:hypothetical protein